MPSGPGRRLPSAADERRGGRAPEAAVVVEGRRRPERRGARAPPQLRGHGRRRRGHRHGAHEPPQLPPSSCYYSPRSPAAATEAAGRRLGQPRLGLGFGAGGGGGGAREH